MYGSGYPMLTNALLLKMNNFHFLVYFYKKFVPQLYLVQDHFSQGLLKTQKSQKRKKGNFPFNQQSTIIVIFVIMLSSLQRKKSPQHKDSCRYGSTRSSSFERAVQMGAFEELLKARAANNNKLRRGDMKEIIMSFHERKLFCVTQNNLEYCYKLHLKGIAGLRTDAPPIQEAPLIQEAPPIKEAPPIQEAPPVGFVEYDAVTSLTFSISSIESIEESNLSNEEEISAGRRLGTQKAAKAKYTKDLRKSIISVATKYIQIQNTAKSVGRQVKKNTQNNLIASAEVEYGLTKMTINRDIVKTRVEIKNPTGYAHQRTSPLSEIELLIVQWCLLSANTGNPLTRESITALANEIIDDTAYSERLSEFKKRRIIANENTVGASWYCGFHKQNSEYWKRSKCKINDQNRINWCTYQNFSNMYDGVYWSMVKAGVAVLD
jgi:septum formation topological specificity factor MinE